MGRLQEFSKDASVSEISQNRPATSRFLNMTANGFPSRCFNALMRFTAEGFNASQAIEETAKSLDGNDPAVINQVCGPVNDFVYAIDPFRPRNQGIFRTAKPYRPSAGHGTVCPEHPRIHLGRQGTW